MTEIIAIPVARIACRVIIDRSRAWSAIDEVILLILTQQARSMREIAALTDQPHQLVVASVARLMRFRLVEVTLGEAGAALKISAFGQAAISSGHPLPVFPSRSSRRFSFVVEGATGEFFPAGPLELKSQSDLRRLPRARILRVEGGGPSLSQADNLARLTQIAVRGWDEQVGAIDSRTATLRQDLYMVIRVADGELQGLPEAAGAGLRAVVTEAAARPAAQHEIVIPYGGPKPQPVEIIRSYDCEFDPQDIVIGGDQHRDLFIDMLRRAHRRMIIHSTFLDATRFAAFVDGFREACLRGVTFDLLWGDKDDDEPEAATASAIAAGDIMALVDREPDLRGRFKVHLASTHSHAKLLLLDTEEDGWIGVLGSCNWIRSPFHSVELSVVLRDQHVVADVCEVLQNMAGQRGLIDGLANELGITARDMRREPRAGGTTKLSIIVGAGHEALMRTASLEPNRSLVIGAHRLGANARTGAVLPGEAAADRKVATTVFYSLVAGPVKKRHARDLKVETAENGVRLVQASKPLLHGKFVTWDDDDVVVSSLNWTSAAADPDHPWNDLGVHIRAPGLANDVLQRLQVFFPIQLAGAEGDVLDERAPKKETA